MAQGLCYDRDESGQEVLLKEGRFQVMMEWEKPYMQACIDALRPFGHVLEIGFGLGYSAAAIQRYQPLTHTIVECDAQVAERARVFAAEHTGVVIVESTWQQALAQLGVFDCIFFDDYPLESGEEMEQQQRESAEAEALLQTGKEVLAGVETQFPFLYELRYTDADLDAIRESLPQEASDQTLQMARFFKELTGRGQIGSMQYRRQIDALVATGKLSETEAREIASFSQEPRPMTVHPDRLLCFLRQVLPSHMRSGSRFSCFLSSADSKYLDVRFCKEIIENPWLDYREELIDIEVPAHCSYFSGDKALVITLTKA